MTFRTHGASFAAAAALVAAVCWLPALEAAPGAASDHTRQVDPDRPVRPDKGPFFGLKVNSMDIEGEAQTLACLEYRCDGLLPKDGVESYQLVSHGYRGAPVRALDCDELLPIAFVGHEARYTADLKTTRWMRMDGPSGTPVGGFVGRLWLNATVRVDSDEGERDVRIPFLDLALIGTTGMRPGRSTVADDAATVNDRCDAPLHDEGYYQGVFNRKGLRTIEKLVRPDSAAHVRILKRLAGSVIAGTFEGRHTVVDGNDDGRDYCDVTASAWWFDGLLGYRCRPSTPDVRITQERERPESRFDGIRGR